MPLIYVCRCGAELGLHFDDRRAADRRRVEGYAYGVEDVFVYLKGKGEPAHDVVDRSGEAVMSGVCLAGYERSGECNCCGECCKYAYQAISEGEAADPDHRRWLELRSGRIDRTSYGAWDVLVHPCRALVDEGPERSICGCYEDRPDICRRWPEHPWDVEPYPKCGFRFTRRSLPNV